MRTQDVARFVPDAAPSSSLSSQHLLQYHTAPFCIIHTTTMRLSDSLAQDPTVLDTLGLFRQDRQVADDIHRRDVAREQQQSLVTLPQRLDDLLHTPLELSSLRRPLDRLEQLLLQLGRRNRRRYWRDGIKRDVELGLAV